MSSITTLQDPHHITIKLKKKEDDPPSEDTEEYFLKAIDKAAEKIKKMNRKIAEGDAKNKVLETIIVEKNDTIKKLNDTLEDEKAKVKIYEKHKSVNKKEICEKINKVFNQRDNDYDELIKKNIEQYEKEMRAKFCS